MPRKKTAKKSFQIAGDTGVDTTLEDYEEGDEFEDDEPEAPIIQKLKPTKQHVEKIQFALLKRLRLKKKRRDWHAKNCLNLKRQ